MLPFFPSCFFSVLVLLGCLHVLGWYSKLVLCPPSCKFFHIVARSIWWALLATVPFFIKLVKNNLVYLVVFLLPPDVTVFLHQMPKRNSRSIWMKSMPYHAYICLYTITQTEDMFNIIKFPNAPYFTVLSCLFFVHCCCRHPAWPLRKWQVTDDKFVVPQVLPI